MLKRKKRLILLSTLLATGAIAAYTFTMTPVYEARSIVSVDTRSTVAENILAVGEKRGLDTEVGILDNSIDLAERVVARLQSAADAIGTDEHFPILHGEDDGRPLSSREIAVRLMRHVAFLRAERQDMISITAESSSPEEAASIANFYAEEYKTFSRDNSRASVVAARQFLERQVTRKEKELFELENQWEAFAREKQVIAQGPEGERLVAQYGALITQREAAELQLEQEEVSVDLLRQQLNQVEPGLADVVQQEIEATALEGELAVVDQRLAELKIDAEQYYAVNPDLKGKTGAIQDLDEINKQIDHFAERKSDLTQKLIAESTGPAGLGGREQGGQLAYVSQLKGRVKEKEMMTRELEAQVGAIDVRLQAYQSSLRNIPRQAIERDQLERRIEQAEAWYKTFVGQLQQTLIAEESELGYVNLVRTAFVPTEPVRPNVRQNIILGILLGLGSGIGLAFLRSALDSKLTKPEDLQEHGYTLIGVVPTMDREIKTLFGGRERIDVKGKSISTRLITYLHPWSPIAENFRLIRTNVQFSDPTKDVRTMIVTSPEPSDGKSVTSVNVAVAMALSGRRTLLVDCDLRRPTLHKLLDEERSPGIGEMLTEANFSLVSARATDVENLWFLPAGIIDTPPGEIFGSDVMKKFIEYARHHFEMVVIDSPPVLAVADTVLLAQLCDATLIVVSADKTNLRALEVTRDTLANVGAPIIGTIFNRFDPKKAGGYNYGYGYGYHMYNGDGAASTAV